MKSVKIGNQEWMVENLSITDDGLGKDHWKNPKNGEVYYSWEAAVRIAQEVKGFHLPSPEEWNQLIENCGGIDATAEALKCTSSLKDYDNISTIKTKLNITFVGCYTLYDKKYVDNDGSYFWTSSIAQTYTTYRCGYIRYFDKNFSEGKYGDIKNGLSVRLVKD